MQTKKSRTFALKKVKNRLRQLSLNFVLNMKVLLPLFLSIVTLFTKTSGVFHLPDLKIQAYNPTGLKVSIPDEPGIQLFAFHGQKNKPLNGIEPGEFSKDITRPTDNSWVYFEPDAKLEVGDVIYYWFFIQHNRLGYRKEDQSFKISVLLNANDTECERSKTRMDQTMIPCSKEIIFEDEFSNSFVVDNRKWLVEEYVPSRSRGPDFEFSAYFNEPGNVFVQDSVLNLKPIARNSDAEVRGTLDLRDKCTKNTKEECFFTQQSFQLIPPVKSGRIRSKFTFKYGKVEIRAKLPSGDWIYPIVALHPANESLKSKIWIAYARGNNELTGDGGDDIGSKMLFGGPVLDYKEPKRSSLLKTFYGNEPMNDQFHNYSLLWEPGKFTMGIDGNSYGSVEYANDAEDGVNFNEDYFVSLGVGVGGINDFPDGYKSGQNSKPWSNQDPKMVRNFFNARNIWMSSWMDDGVALKIDYVKVWSL